MVYPALLAATGDAVHPGERATALGVYRFWRDAGAIGGALAAGALADVFGFNAAIQVVAALTAASGVVAALTLRSPPPRIHRPRRSLHEHHPVRPRGSRQQLVPRRTRRRQRLARRSRPDAFSAISTRPSAQRLADRCRARNAPSRGLRFRRARACRPRVGAKLFLPAGARVAVAASNPSSASRRLAFDGLEVEAVGSPGHTPEHVSYVAQDGRASAGAVQRRLADRRRRRAHGPDLARHDGARSRARSSGRCTRRSRTCRTRRRSTRRTAAVRSARPAQRRRAHVDARRGARIEPASSLSATRMSSRPGSRRRSRRRPTTTSGCAPFNQAGPRLRRDIAAPPLLAPAEFNDSAPGGRGHRCAPEGRVRERRTYRVRSASRFAMSSPCGSVGSSRRTADCSSSPATCRWNG